MGNVRRVYVEKKEPYAVHAKELKEEIKRYLGIKDLTNVRVLIRYDIENLSDATYKLALQTVFQSRRLTSIMKKILLVHRMWLSFLWNIFRDSLISVPILLSSV